MLQTIGYSGHNGNVALSFSQQKERDIKAIRNRLLRNLEEYDPSIALAVQKLLDERIKNAVSPLIGELYPHILNDLVSGIELETLTEVSAHWLAAYVLTIMIDNSFDTGEIIDGRLIAPLYLEASKLQKRVGGTKYADMFERLTFEAVRGQIMDTKLQRELGRGEEKLTSAQDKNKILSAFSVVIASLLQDSKEQDFAISFTENFLISTQMLDDISDFEGDYADGNKTFILSEIDDSQLNLTRRDLLEQLVSSGMLQKTLSLTIDALNKGVEMVKNRNDCASEFIRLLTSEVSLLHSLALKCGGTKNKASILDKIDQQIKRVAQST